MSTSYTDVFTGKSVTPAFPQYSAIALIEDIDLSWPAQFQNTNYVVSVTMDITPDAGGRTVTMPTAKEAPTGFTFTINNPGQYAFQLLTNTGTVITTIESMEASLIWLIDNTSDAGVWRQIPAFGGAGAVSFINATSDSDNLVVTGDPSLPITTGGTIQFSLQQDLLALSQFADGAVGFPARTGTNLWALRSLAGTANQIMIANTAGTAANPTISLAPNITGVNSLTLAGLSFGQVAANVIASTGGNTNIEITPNGTGIIGLNKDSTLAAGKNLKFVADNGVNYISFRAGASAANQQLVWPTVAGVAGQVMANDGLEGLYWASIPTIPGLTTVDAVARYSNTSGSLKNSLNFKVTDGGAATGLVSCEIGDLLFCLADTHTVSTRGASQDFIVAPNGNGNFRVQGDITVAPSSGFQRKLRIYDTAGNFYTGFQSPAVMTANVIWNFPQVGGVAGYLASDATNTLSVQPFTAFFPILSTTNAVPRFSNTTGYPLKNSLLVIDDAGVATGLTSNAIGNTTITSGQINNSAGTLTIASAGGISISNNIAMGSNTITGTGANTAGTLALSIATASTSITTGGLTTLGGLGVSLKAYIGGALNVTDTTDSTTVLTGSGIFSGGVGIAKSVTAGGNISLINSGTTLALRLYNSAATFYTGLQAGAAAGNVTFTLPLAAPAATGIIKSSSSGVMTIDSLGAAAGTLRTDGSGNIVVNNITTAANQMAKYSDTVGTFSISGVYCDGNSNFSIGTTTVGTSATGTLTLVAGTPTSAMGSTFLSVGTRNTGTGYVLALFGGNDGGISASTTNTVTTKISVYVNGTRYYLLASTSGT